jgi:hypothetical protein
MVCPLFIRHTDAASVTLAWDPNSEPDVAGYKLYYGKASGTYESVVDVGNQTTYTILGSLDRETYYFAVTAYNVYGLESVFSDEVSYPGPPSVTISLSPGLEPHLFASTASQSFNINLDRKAITVCASGSRVHEGCGGIRYLVVL